MFMMIKLNNKIYIILLQDYLYVLLYKVIMQQYLRMGKQEREKLIQCKDLNIIFMIMIEE